MAINDQMEMAFNGQAPQVDPVSGNEVPPGSLPVEVRDDIDARLSEGEYVVPADVVRYFGVKYFEDLRLEAKLGLSGMEADGRIGGEPMAVDPSGMPPEGMPPEGMDISEEDIAALEQALTTGVANGGLMDKMARVAKYDPLVNSRMNAGGLVVGFAEGGAVSSLYEDPTRIDALIQKVTAAAQSNPALMGELAKRGVSVNTTQANMDPDAMQQANNQVQSFVEGGGVAPTYNPSNFPLGFSTFGPGSPGTEDISAKIDVAYYNPTTNENRTFQHYAGTNLPVNPIPAGFVLGSAPATSRAGIQAIVDSGKDITGGDNKNGPAIGSAAYNALQAQQVADPSNWVKKYDYSDPDALASTIMDSIDDKETGLQDLLTTSIFGKFIGNGIYLRKARQINTNIEWLKSIAITPADNKKADDLAAQLKIYISDRDVKGDIKGDKNKYVAQDIIDQIQGTQLGQEQIIRYNAARMKAMTAERNKRNNPEGKEWYELSTDAEVAAAQAASEAEYNRPSINEDDDDISVAAQAQAQSNLAKKNREYAKASGINVPTDDDDPTDYFVGNKGGFVSRPKKKTKKK